MVKKIHGRRKRYIPIGTSRNRKPRMKTFTTEVVAKAYAEKLELKSYSIEKTKYGLGKKYKIVAK